MQQRVNQVIIEKNISMRFVRETESSVFIKLLMCFSEEKILQNYKNEDKTSCF